MKNLKRQIRYLSLSVVVILGFISGIAVAATSVSKGYLSEDIGLKPGMAVSLSEKSNEEQQFVERASTENRSKYIGVATQIDDSIVTITDSGANIYVSNSGQYSVYVSDLNGEVKKAMC